jgi:hypothetical protein
LIGEGVAVEFMAFLKWSDKIPDINRMLAGEIKPTIPKRPDQRYAMLSAIVHHMRQHEEPESILNGFIDVMLKFPNDWVQLLYHDITLLMDSQGNDEFLEALFEHPLHDELENRIVV